MSWADVQAKFKFYGPEGGGLDGQPEFVNGVRAVNVGVSFNLSEKNQILANLEALYNGSAAARAVLEAADSRDIWLLKTVTKLSFVPTFDACQVVAVNLSAATSIQWMGRNGRFQTEGLTGTLIHELTHAILGSPDLVSPDGIEYDQFQFPGNRRDYNAANFDHVGETQKITNAVLRDLFGQTTAYQQVGYDANIQPRNEMFLRTDISYSEYRKIDIAYFDSILNKTPDDLDLSTRIDFEDNLIMGFGGDDKINGGAGRDYLYGGIHNDTISGGSGDDVINGGDLKTGIAFDGEDTADYSIGDMQGRSLHGVTINVDRSVVSESDKMEGLTPIIVSDDGYGGRDRLFSIEKIKLTKHQDTVTFANDSEDLLTWLKEIDAGENPEDEPDILDFSQLTTGISVKNGKLESTGTEFKNFDKILGTAKNDTLDFSNATVKLEIRGGVGTDEIKGGAGADKLFGENDDDTIDGGGDRDEIWVASGTTPFTAGRGRTSSGADPTFPKRRIPTRPTRSMATVETTKFTARRGMTSFMAAPMTTSCPAMPATTSCSAAPARIG
jgi:hypothetical protein